MPVHSQGKHAGISRLLSPRNILIYNTLYVPSVLVAPPETGHTAARGWRPILLTKDGSPDSFPFTGDVSSQGDMVDCIHPLSALPVLAAVRLIREPPPMCSWTRIYT